MQILDGIDGLRALPAGAVMTIGNFDGVHRGHQRIIELCRQRREENKAPVALVTFEPHPLTVLRPSAVPPRLTPPLLKQELFQSLGVEFYVVLPPTPEVLNMSAEEFWRILRDEAKPRYLLEGPAFNFGKNRGGNVRKLAEWAAGTGVRFELIEPVTMPLLDLRVVAVSSSLIRWLLSQGRVRDAAICLGRAYTLRGKVVRGFERGRKIGFPTANLQCGDQLVPADGIYAGRCRIGSTMHLCAVSIGDMPTFGEGVRQIEAYVLDFEGDLYGHELDVQFVDWLRGQAKFSGIETLTAQIAEDILQTRRRGEMDPSVAIAESASESGGFGSEAPERQAPALL
jgi:riboflavin kinase / FMN adenylyltransferase